MTDLIKACAITSAAYSQIRPLIIAGISELELARQIDIYLGGFGPAFGTIVAAGVNTTELHHKPTKRKIEKQDIILLDFGAKYNCMCSDMSRTIFVGSPKPEWLKIYRIVESAQLKAIEQLNNRTIKSSYLDSVARDYITKKGFGKQFVHSLGHGIGKKVHERFKIGPKSGYTIKPGDAFTIEPGIYLPGKFGVRIEDTVLLTKESVKILTNLV